MTHASSENNSIHHRGCIKVETNTVPFFLLTA